MSNQKQKKSPAPRPLEEIAKECRELEQQLGQKQYVKLVIEAEIAQCAQKLLALNNEAALAQKAAAK